MDKIALRKKKTVTLKCIATQQSHSSGSESSFKPDISYKPLRNIKHKEYEGEVQ